ncbi:MAG: hypothetical protein KDC54_01010, partial [Lewinella sp.]|nr:hypothetical protein [Lewinella sp.]
LFCQVYPADSLEYFFPVWRFPVDRQHGYSLLGRGIHTALLRVADTLLADFPSTTADVTTLTAALMDDMMGDDIAYWESREKVMEELKELLEKPPQFLSAEQKVRLHQRWQLFRDGGATTPVTNMRSGQVNAGMD